MTYGGGDAGIAQCIPFNGTKIMSAQRAIRTLNDQTNLHRSNLFLPVCPWSAKKFPNNQNAAKNHQKRACLVLMVFCCVQRCALRAAWTAQLALFGNDGRRKNYLAENPVTTVVSTQPSSVPSQAPRRNVSVKTVYGKPRNRSGGNAASFASFPGARKEGLRPSPSVPRYQSSLSPA